MNRMPATRRTMLMFSALAFCFVSALTAGEAESRNNGRLHRSADPAEALLSEQLSDTDAKRLRDLFEKLSSDDFEERQRAQDGILKFGSRAIPMAQHYATHDDVETRQFARGFQQALILRYHGYWPVSAELKAALDTPRRVFIGKQESFRGALERFLRDSELTAAFSWKNCPERIIGTNETIELNLPAGKALEKLLQYVEMTAVPRGPGIAGVTQDKVPALLTQEHCFPTASLAPKQRERLAAQLAAWLPPNAQFTASENGIEARGSEAELRLAARAIYFLAPEALELPPFNGLATIVPLSPDRNAVRSLRAALETPVVEFSMAGIEPLRGLARLRAAGHPVETEESTPELVPQQPAVSLELHGLPLGLTLRWLMLRANAPEANKVTPAVRLDFQLAVPDQNEKPAAAPKSKVRVITRLAPGDSAIPLSETVGCTDVSFLFPVAAAKPTPEDADTAVCERIRAQFEDELALFPCEERDFALFVFNRRAIARGPGALIRRWNEFLQTWRETQMPPRTKWRDELTELIQREVEWDGRSLTVKTLLPRIREVIGINVLLERTSPTGHDFEIDSRDMELLPPGKYRASELFKRLGAVSQSLVIPRWGAMVLTPAAKTPDPGEKPKF